MRPWMLASVLSLAACGSETGAQTLMSDGGAYQLELVLSPAEPVSGEDVEASVQVRTDADMASVSGATVALEPWMPAHDHGIPDEVSISDDGDGLYTGTFAFSMPGSWELRVQVDDELATGRVEVR